MKSGIVFRNLQKQALGVEIKSNYLRPLLMNKYGIQDEAEMFHERGIGNQTLVIPPNQGTARSHAL